MLKQRAQTTEPKLKHHKKLPLHICKLPLSQSTLPLNQCSNATRECSKGQKLLNMPNTGMQQRAKTAQHAQGG
jgi:hypothetical protein